MSPQRGGEDSGAANERAAEAPPLPSAGRTPRQLRRRGRGRSRLGPPPSPRPAPRQRRPGCCQLSQRPTQPRCMLNRCGRRLLHVLGLSFPLLTGRPLFLFPHRFMKPQVVFVLGGPGAGKGTQCARIVEVRPGQPAGSLGLTGHRAGPSRRAWLAAPPPTPPPNRRLRVPAADAPRTWRWSRVRWRAACRDW